MIRGHQQNKDATIYIGDLNDHVTDDILLELFMQVGPVVSVNIPKDRITNRHQGYGFVEFRSEQDAEYALTIMQGIKLYGTPIRISTNVVNKNVEEIDVGARLYIGNLAPEANDTTLLSIFKEFGNVQTCRVAMDPATGKSLGHGFVSYDSFESADLAKKQMNGQYVCQQPITVSYAFKVGSKKGEKHGDASERRIAPSMAAAAKLKKIQKNIGVLPTSETK